MTTREHRRRTHHLNRALKHCPGRADITLLEGLATYLTALAAETGDHEAARALHRAVEVLLDLRVAAHGGKKAPPNRHYED